MVHGGVAMGRRIETVLKRAAIQAFGFEPQDERIAVPHTLVGDLSEIEAPGGGVPLLARSGEVE